MNVVIAREFERGITSLIGVSRSTSNVRQTFQIPGRPIVDRIGSWFGPTGNDDSFRRTDSLGREVVVSVAASAGVCDSGGAV